MLAALNTINVDRFFVTTDDENIMKVAKENRFEIIERPPELATKEALGEDVYCHAYEYIRDILADAGEMMELVVLLMCNAATVTASMIDEGIDILRKEPSYDSAVSVSSYNMWSPLRARKIGEDGLLHPFVPFDTFGDPATLNCDRDSQGDVWFADMGVSIVRPQNLEKIEMGMLPQKWMGRRIYPLRQWGGCDIDYEWQVPGVEFWLRRHGFTETVTPYG
jgi:hypothetical protein